MKINLQNVKNHTTAESMSYILVSYYKEGEESKKGRMADALAHGGDEGRDKLR